MDVSVLRGWRCVCGCGVYVYVGSAAASVTLALVGSGDPETAQKTARRSNTFLGSGAISSRQNFNCVSSYRKIATIITIN